MSNIGTSFGGYRKISTMKPKQNNINVEEAPRTKRILNKPKDTKTDFTLLNKQKVGNNERNNSLEQKNKNRQNSPFLKQNPLKKSKTGRTLSPKKNSNYNSWALPLNDQKTKNPILPNDNDIHKERTWASSIDRHGFYFGDDKTPKENEFLISKKIDVVDGQNNGH